MKFKLITPSHLEQHLALWGINLPTVFWLCDIKMRFYCRFFSRLMCFFSFFKPWFIPKDENFCVYSLNSLREFTDASASRERNHVWFNYVRRVNEKLSRWDLFQDSSRLCGKCKQLQQLLLVPLPRRFQCLCFGRQAELFIECPAMPTVAHLLRLLFILRSYASPATQNHLISCKFI